MAGTPCPMNCGCGRHRRTSCLPGCDCFRHTARSRGAAATLDAAFPQLRSIVPRDEDPTITSTLRAYLAAFDEHLRAVAHDDHHRAEMSRMIMTAMLAGVRAVDPAEPGRQRRSMDLL